MERRSFLATLCGVALAPLVATARPALFGAATRTMWIDGPYVPTLSLGTLVSIEGRDYSEVLRIVAVHGDASYTVERG